MSAVSTEFLARRRAALARHPTQTGLDALAVQARGDTLTLQVSFVPPQIEGKAFLPGNLGAHHVRILDVDRPGRDPFALAVEATDTHLLITIDGAPEQEPSAPYELQLVGHPQVDPFFDRLRFTLQIDEPNPRDCAAAPREPEPLAEQPPISYLGRDYRGFRKLMLDRLGQLLPGSEPPHAADAMTAIVEVLAYAADQTSLYQDAVATEAYLGTARRRVSVHRHARLVDYHVHEGCNARVWVHVEVSEELSLAAGTVLLTGVPGVDPAFERDGAEHQQARRGRPEVFETLHPARLHPGQNELRFYAWGADQLTLPRGATTASIAGHAPLLAPGDELVLCERRGPGGGSPQTSAGLLAEADPEHRHAVRLTRVQRSSDPLGGALSSGTHASAPTTEIEWDEADALPFALVTTALVGGTRVEDMAVALGNIVLADHGETRPEQALPPDVRPRLPHRDLTWSVPYVHAEARSQPARSAMIQDPTRAWPVVDMSVAGEPWTARRDLLDSSRFADDFVIETESDRQARVRFGDGIFGRRPPPDSPMRAVARVGNGPRGNVGPGAISHVITSQAGIMRVDNPLPARGGTEPEPLAQIKIRAPLAFHRQERAVTTADYAAMAERHPEVVKAAASEQWTGSWSTITLTVHRVDNRPVDQRFERALLAFLGPFRLVGQVLRVARVVYVALDLALEVRVALGASATQIRVSLAEQLGSGPGGFFHTANFSFGDPVYSSRIVARAMAVPGVARVELTRFERWGRQEIGELRASVLDPGPLAIIRVDGDPDHPERGRLELRVEGGR